MKKNLVSLAVFGAFLALGSQVAMAAPDWSKAAKSTIHVFHPGAAPIEWVQGKGEHSGASGLKKGERPQTSGQQGNGAEGRAEDADLPGHHAGRL